MKKTLLALAMLLCGSLAAFGQAITHKATLTWDDSLNPAGTVYTVTRATGVCTGSPVFSTLATGIAVKTYVDSTVTPGNYCYQVVAVAGGVPSVGSNPGPASVPAFAVTNFQVQVQ